MSRLELVGIYLEGWLCGDFWRIFPLENLANPPNMGNLCGIIAIFMG